MQEEKEGNTKVLLFVILWKKSQEILKSHKNTGRTEIRTVIQNKSKKKNLHKKTGR